jgi:hypothetical protein
VGHHLACVYARIKWFLINKELFLIHYENKGGMNFEDVLDYGQKIINRLPAVRMIGIIHGRPVIHERKCTAKVRELLGGDFCFWHFSVLMNSINTFKAQDSDVDDLLKN